MKKVVFTIWLVGFLLFAVSFLVDGEFRTDLREDPFPATVAFFAATLGWPFAAVVFLVNKWRERGSE